MKKYLEIAVGVMAAAGAVASAQAQSVVNPCTGEAAGKTYTVTPTAGATNEFVAVTFTGTCSANVILSYQQNATLMAVAAASRKGANTFSGTTNGGSVRPDTAQKCAKTGCEVGKVNGALTTAYEKATSS